MTAAGKAEIQARPRDYGPRDYQAEGGWEVFNFKLSVFSWSQLTLAATGLRDGCRWGMAARRRKTQISLNHALNLAFTEKEKHAPRHSNQVCVVAGGRRIASSQTVKKMAKAMPEAKGITCNKVAGDFPSQNNVSQ